MSTSAQELRFDENTMWVELTDGRTLGIPLAWFPRLLRATLEQRQRYRISVSGNGLHWEEIDEDISVEGLLAGHGDLTHRRKQSSEDLVRSERRLAALDASIDRGIADANTARVQDIEEVRKELRERFGSKGSPST